MRRKIGKALQALPLSAFIQRIEGGGKASHKGKSKFKSFYKDADRTANCFSIKFYSINVLNHLGERKIMLHKLNSVSQTDLLYNL